MVEAAAQGFHGGSGVDRAGCRAARARHNLLDRIVELIGDEDVAVDIHRNAFRMVEAAAHCENRGRDRDTAVDRDHFLDGIVGGIGKEDVAADPPQRRRG